MIIPNAFSRKAVAKIVFLFEIKKVSLKLAINNRCAGFLSFPYFVIYYTTPMLFQIGCQFFEDYS
jgi:hypothetical protein